MFFVAFIWLNFFTFTENKMCSWSKGLECCLGYSLNKYTGECEKCPVGYFGDCSKQCIPPTFGEDCQLLCNCADGYYCHFAYGCSQLDRSKTELQHTSTTGHFSSSQTSTSSSHHPDSKVVVTTLSYSIGSHLPNDCVFHIIIGLVGIFVSFFVLHVVTYVYSKFFRRTSKQQCSNENLQIRYRSLNFETTEQEPTLYSVSLDQQGQMLADPEYLSPDSSYLSPIIDKKRTEELAARENETINRSEETVRDSVSTRQNVYLPADDTKQGPSSRPVDRTEHVYIDIVEN